MIVVVLRCACGARERIHTSRALAASWTHREYACTGCLSPAESDDPETLALQSEPVAGEPAKAL
jgi:hypothetical protein